MKAYHRLAGNRSLRTITLISTLFSTLWCLAAGIALIKAHTDSSNTAGLNNFFLGVGCAYLVVSGLEGFGFGACFTVSALVPDRVADCPSSRLSSD